MKKIFLAIFLMGMVIGSVALSYADQISARDIRFRIRETRERIERGIDSGALTRNEARGLLRELDQLRDGIRHMKDDGYLSPRERERIDREIDRINRHIRREIRDNDRRGPGFDRRGPEYDRRGRY